LPNGNDSTSVSTRISSDPTSNTMSFTANGQAVTVDHIGVSESGVLGYPFILAMARAVIPATHDTLGITLQFNDRNMIAYGKFMGIYADTTSTGRTSYFTAQDGQTLWDYMTDWTQGTYIYANIATNDGTTITGTFNGNIHCASGGVASTSYLLVTNGTFKLKL